MTATMKIELESVVDFVAKVRDSIEVNVNVSKLPANVRAYVWEYGLQRVINDACGKAGKKDTYATEALYLEACRNIAEAKRDAMYAGDVRMARGSTPKDAVAEECRKIAITALKAKGTWPKDKDEAIKALAEFIERNREKLVAKAEKIVAEREEMMAEFD